MAVPSTGEKTGVGRPSRCQSPPQWLSTLSSWKASGAAARHLS
jgi:hypothetical protein